jgi:large repetitive protein
LYNVTASNNSEIFYIDTYPAMGTGTTKDVTQAYETIAHEFQHMVNFNRNVLIEGSSENMDTWLNESLSMAAEQVYSGVGLSDRVDYYNAATSITNGHSLLYWDDYGDTLSNYSLSYLFGQYIKIQTGQGDRIFKEILNDPSNDYKAIENVAKKYISPSMTFGKLMTNFRIALLFKEPSGIYGFKGDPFFNALEEKIYTGSSQNLRGGGAVVTTFNSKDGFTIPTSKGPNITYSTFNMEEGPGEVDLTPPPAPVVNAVTNADTTVTGTTEANATVKVYVGTQQLGSAKADTKGKFTVTIPVQNIGVKLQVTSTDAAGNVSAPKEVTVTKAPPAAPKVNGVTQVDKIVTGTAITNSIIYVKVGSTVIGSGKTTPQGNFAVTIPEQPVGTKLGVVVRDSEGTFSTYSYVTVTQKPAPLAPTVNVITDKSTSVIGTAEKNSTVYVKIGSVVIGKATPDVQGNFYIDIPVQKLGTKIGVVVRDAAGQFSPYTYSTVVQKTAPFAPKVFNITDKTTVVTGTAEINTTIYVKSGSVVLGSGRTDILGNFAITISAQVTGTKISVVVRDSAGKFSPTTNLIVMEKTVPFAPSVNEVNDTATVVTGTAEANTTIYVKVGSTVIGRGKTNAEGNFSIVIPVQKVGTKIGVVVRDAEAKFSPYTYVTVVASK